MTGRTALAWLVLCFVCRRCSTSLLTAAIEKYRKVPYKECMRKGLKRDSHFREVFQHASTRCRSGLKSFYCQRVADVPKVRESSPLERLCSGNNATLAVHSGVPTTFEFTDSREAKVAFFVLAFGYPENLSRLVSRLVNGIHNILVHVDLKRPQYFDRVQQWISTQNLTGTVHAISKFRVNRGGASTLRAWLYGVSWLLSNAGHWDYYINLNDSDYPIASLQVIGRFLWLNNGANYVNVGSAYKDCDCGRFLVFECDDELYSLAPEIRYPRRPSFEHASGPNLVAISRALAEHVNAQQKVSGSTVRQILDDLMILQQPDEKFFQTLLVNSPFCTSHLRWSFHMWDRPGLSQDSSSPEIAGPELKMLTPPLLSDSFWPRLLEVKEKRLSIFFARKFDNNRTVALQDAIDKAVDDASSAFHDDRAEGWHTAAQRSAAGLRWFSSVLSALLGMRVESQGAVATWHFRGISEGMLFKTVRFRSSVQLPCSSLPSVRVAVRGCDAHGAAAFEERAARPQPPKSPNQPLPRLVALRVGANWNSEQLDFGGSVSVIPQEEASEVLAVLYWASVLPGERREAEPLDITIRWTDARGRTARDHATVASNSLVSWSRLPMATLKSQGSSASATRIQMGEWRVDVFVGSHRLGNRTFYVCSERCEDVPSAIARTYFRMLPV